MSSTRGAQKTGPHGARSRPGRPVAARPRLQAVWLCDGGAQRGPSRSAAWVSTGGRVPGASGHFPTFHTLRGRTSSSPRPRGGKRGSGWFSHLPTAPALHGVTHKSLRHPLLPGTSLPSLTGLGAASQEGTPRLPPPPPPPPPAWPAQAPGQEPSQQVRPSWSGGRRPSLGQARARLQGESGGASLAPVGAQPCLSMCVGCWGGIEAQQRPRGQGAAPPKPGCVALGAGSHLRARLPGTRGHEAFPKLRTRGRACRRSRRNSPRSCDGATGQPLPASRCTGPACQVGEPRGRGPGSGLPASPGTAATLALLSGSAAPDLGCAPPASASPWKGGVPAREQEPTLTSSGPGCLPLPALKGQIKKQPEWGCCPASLAQ